MARRKGFMATLAKASRETEKARVRQIRQQTQLAKEAERTRKAYLRAFEQEAKADEKAQKLAEKEEAKLYIESCVAQVALQNEQLEEEIEELDNLLKATLSVDDFLERVMNYKQ